MAQAMATTDHETIKRWAEARKGHPAVVRATEGRRGRGLLRIDFDAPEESLGAIGWDEFFEIFEENELVFLYQDQTASGRKSRFNKFVSRDSVDPTRSEGPSERRADGSSEADGEDNEMGLRTARQGRGTEDDEDEDYDAIEDDDEEEDDDQQRRRN